MLAADGLRQLYRAHSGSQDQETADQRLTPTPASDISGERKTRRARPARNQGSAKSSTDDDLREDAGPTTPRRRRGGCAGLA